MPPAHAEGNGFPVGSIPDWEYQSKKLNETTLVDRDVLFCHKVTKTQTPIAIGVTKFNILDFLLCAILWLNLMAEWIFYLRID